MKDSHPITDLQTDRQKPAIKQRQMVASSRLFKIEEVHLHFSNGEQRIYECLAGKARGAVMIVPLLDNDTVLLVREYAVGLHSYELSLPKGLCESNEDLFETANRELQEEVGYAAKQFSQLKSLAASPGHLAGKMNVVLAQDLYPSKLPGDEPEELEVLTWSLRELDKLIAREDFSEARSIAALYMVKEMMNS